jgi:hypothetical protein
VLYLFEQWPNFRREIHSFHYEIESTTFRRSSGQSKIDHHVIAEVALLTRAGTRASILKRPVAFHSIRSVISK